MTDPGRAFWQSPEGKARLAYNSALGRGKTPYEALLAAIQVALATSHLPNH